jgi:hypothetical protein
MEEVSRKPEYITKSFKLYNLTLKFIENKNILQYFEKIIFSKKRFDIKDVILIAGTPRSGTTWLMDIMTTIPDYTSLFEPINPVWFPESFQVGFKSRTYLPVDKNWKEGEDYLRKIFTGKMVSRVPNYQLNLEVIMRRLLGHKLIIKAVRLNRMLPWITKRFKLRGVFFIIRHPCAVISSQLKTGFYGYHPSSPPYNDICPNLDDILEEASMINGLDTDLLNKLKKIKSKEEILAAAWCLDNYVPLSYPKPHPWTTVIYEKLAKEGEKEITRYFNEIGEKKIPSLAIKHSKRASLVTITDEAKNVSQAGVQLSKWKKSLSEKQIERILRIVSDFGLDFYSNDPEPDYDNINIRL